MKMTAGDVAKAREGKRLNDTSEVIAALAQRDVLGLELLLRTHPQLEAYRTDKLQCPYGSFSGTPFVLANRLLERAALVGPESVLAELEQIAVRTIMQVDHCAVVCGVRASERVAITPEFFVVPTSEMEASGDLPVERIQNTDSTFVPDYGTFGGRSCHCLFVTQENAPRVAEFLALLPQLEEWQLLKPISWFGPAAQLQIIKPEEAIAYATMAYEGLLAPGKGSVTLRFKQRGAYLMSDDPTSRADWFDFFGDLYDYRSAIVHGSEVEDPQKLTWLVGRAIQNYPDCVRRLGRAGNPNEPEWNKIVLGAPIAR